MTKQEMELKIMELQKIIIEKNSRIAELEETLKQKYNARNAGRRPADEKWVQSYSRWVELYESQKSISEIMQEMQISRATHYRHKRLYEETRVL